MTSQRGEKNHNARLTDKEVREIRARYRRALRNSRQLAEEYGVKKATVHAILQGKSWKHLDV